MINQIFQKIDCPSSQKANPINETAEWFTWTVQVAEFLDRWAEIVENLEEPKLIFTSDDEPYNYTFSLEPQLIRDINLHQHLDSFAQALSMTMVSDKIMLLTGLFNRDFDGRSLHFLFSCLRDKLVTYEKDPTAALYPPLGLTNEGSTCPIVVDFPLHCDLYAPKFLFNVFENVPNDDSGASLFMRTNDLLSILETMSNIPDPIKCKILNCINNDDGADHYEEFFDLLHGYDRQYVHQLENKMLSKQKRIKLTKAI